MKRVFLVMVLYLAGWACMMAQAPAGFSFQAAVRDNAGQVAANRVVNIKISILQGGESGTEVYSEFHSSKTNTNGLVSLVVGEGSNASGSLVDIDWKSGGSYFLKMEADADGGMNYQLVATTQLLAVPYALHARTAERFDGTIGFDRITDVPDNLGFSGSWNDLKDVPDNLGFSGSWNDLTDVPETIGFSGEYADLKGRPNIADSVERYGFPGTWEALDGKPNLFDWTYQSLKGKPVFKDSVEAYGFSGDYAALKGKPDFAGDSVTGWSRYIDYDLIPNKPTLSEDGKFSGSYDDLTGKPEIRVMAGEEIAKRLDTLRYATLHELPVFADSVRLYGFTGRWDDLTGKPVLRDSIEEWNKIMDYRLLANLPALKDTVEKYAPQGEGTGGVSSWNDLTDKPNLKDTVGLYGFSGEYEDLEGRPTGNNEGDLLYWSNESWNILPMGEEGQMLTIAGGKLAWIDPSFTTTAANTYRVGEIYKNANGEPEGVVVEVSSVGRYAKIASLKEYTASWDPKATMDIFQPGYVGDRPVEVGTKDKRDGMANTQKIRTLAGWETNYPVFAETEGEWYLPASEELGKLYEAKDKANMELENVVGADKLEGKIYWSSTENDSAFAFGYTFQTMIVKDGEEEVEIAAGQVYENLKGESCNVRLFKSLSWAEVTNKPDTGRVYRVGDIYLERSTSKPLGIVYKISNGGRHGMVVSYKQVEATWTDAQTAFGNEWRLPTMDEAIELLQHRYDINASMENYMQGNADVVKIADDGTYWTADVVEIIEEIPGQDGQMTEQKYPGANVIFIDRSNMDIMAEPKKQTEISNARAIMEF